MKKAFAGGLADYHFGRIVGITALLLVTLSLSFTPPVAAGGQRPLPPQSPSFGKTLDEWMLLYWTSILSGEQDGQVRNVRFLPMPALEPTGEPNFFVGELAVMLPPGTAFVTPVLAFTGETFVEEGVPDDIPENPPKEIFTDATVRVTLDGQALIDSSVEDLERYFFDAVFFVPPIPYNPPQPRGPGVTADSTIWVKGLGFTYPPLSVGEHTLTMFVNIEGVFGFFNTWHITVRR